LKLSVLVMALVICGVSAPTREATVDNRQIETSNTLCVVDVTGLPVPVRFEKSMTLTQAIEQAGIAREDIKDRVWVFRRLQSNLIQPTRMDLKRIQKGAPDLNLDEHDIVYVEARKKHSKAGLEAIGRSCEICGLRLRPLMHGGFVLFPKEWSPSNEPSEKNRDPNNQKP